MGYHKLVLKPGNGTDKPKKSDTVTIQYTGNLYDESKGKEQHYRGSKYAYLADWVRPFDMFADS